MIPKIIHYCWLSNDPVPEEFIHYMNGWHEKMPDYKFVKWDFSIFDKESSIWVSEAFDNRKYAFAADYIRLYAVYNYGGIYLDMDMEVLKPFDELLSNEYMFAAERSKEPWIEAGCFGAEKHNKFIGMCLERYNDRHFIKEDGSFDQLPLPKVMEEVRDNNGIKLNLYPWYFFTAKSYDTGIEYPNDYTYTIHHFAGSWKAVEEIEIIRETQKYSRIFGHRIGHNIAEYKFAIQLDGFRGMMKLTIDKVVNKIRGGYKEK